jgi:GT2 family glycosyltransferase
VRPEPPSFDLVVATVGREADLARLLESIDAQDYTRVRVLVVDQNEDGGVSAVLGQSAVETVHLQSERGLSRARNVALARIEADLVAFPDDDCTYEPGTLRRVAERFAARAELDGLTGRSVDRDGRSAPSWRRDAAVLDTDNLWNRAISYTIFLRREVVVRTGAFDERLGLGSDGPWSSGEEIDYLVRALRSGAHVEYDPDLVVRHDIRVDDAGIGYRDGASIGYILRKNGYPAKTVARMLVRPAGGIAASLAQRDVPGARYRLATLRGRLRGYLGASSSKISA